MGNSKLVKRKFLAKDRLEKLTKKGLMPCVYKDFTESGLLYYSDRSPLGGMLYWANDLGSLPEKVERQIKELEEKYSATVYHITHEHLAFGECYDLWCITDEDLDYGEEEFDNDNITFAYVMNMTDPDFSEFGSIRFELQGGGAVRTA